MDKVETDLYLPTLHDSSSFYCRLLRMLRHRTTSENSKGGQNRRLDSVYYLRQYGDMVICDTSTKMHKCDQFLHRAEGKILSIRFDWFEVERSRYLSYIQSTIGEMASGLVNQTHEALSKQGKVEGILMEGLL